MYGSVFSPLLPLVVITRSLKLYQKVIVVFIITSFSADLLSIYVIRGSNYNFLHLYGLVESLILFWFYSIVLDNSKKWIYPLAMVFSLFYLINSYWYEWDQFNTVGRSAESIIFIFLSLVMFYQFFKKEEDIFLERSPLFWINIAILIYFSGAFFSFILSKIILSPGKLSWVLHNSANMLKNLILAIGLWKARPK